MITSNITDDELRELVANLAINSAKTDKQLAKTDAKLDKVAKMIGSIGNNLGDVAEEFFYNSLADNPILAGVKYDFIDKNITRRKAGIEDEFDIVLVNGKDIAIIETKYKAHNKDLNSLIEKKYTNFKKLYPEYANYTHHLGLASFYINDDLKNQALDVGVMILQRKGDIIETTQPK